MIKYILQYIPHQQDLRSCGAIFRDRLVCKSTRDITGNNDLAGFRLNHRRMGPLMIGTSQLLMTAQSACCYPIHLLTTAAHFPS